MRYCSIKMNHQGGFTAQQALRIIKNIAENECGDSGDGSSDDPTSDTDANQPAGSSDTTFSDSEVDN